MANLLKIIKSKKYAKQRLLKEIKENPNKGMYEVLAAKLREHGVEVQDVNNTSEIDEKIKKLPASKRNKIQNEVKEYGKVYIEVMKEATRGKFDGLKKLPEAFADTCLKGAGAGITAASAVSLLFPNLVPTLGGYLAAVLPAETVVKAGLFLASSALPVSTTGVVVMGVGATIGATAAILGKGTVASIKGVSKGIKKIKGNTEITNKQNHRKTKMIDREERE